MNLNALKYLIAIEENGSLSETAGKLFVSQPYLSKILRSVEEEYDLMIFKRTGSGLVPTVQGRHFLDSARAIIRETERFDDVYRERSKSISFCISSFPSSYSLGAFVRFMKEQDRNLVMRCHYFEKSDNEVIDDVYSGNADLGIIFMKEKQAESVMNFFDKRRITCVKLFETTPHLLVRKGHPLLSKDELTIDDLYSFNIAAFEPVSNANNIIIDTGYYNEETISHIIDYEKFRRIIYVKHRGTLHSILTQSDCIFIGNHTVGSSLDEFHLSLIPLSRIKGLRDPEAFGNTMFYIHLKDEPLSSYLTEYLEILKDYRPAE